MPVRLPSEPRDSALYLKGYHDAKLDYEVKHGRWEPGKEISRTMLCNETIAIDYEDWHCSVCGRRYKEYVLPYRYCPHCGAKMDMEDEGEV